MASAAPTPIPWYPGSGVPLPFANGCVWVTTNNTAVPKEQVGQRCSWSTKPIQCCINPNCLPQSPYFCAPPTSEPTPEPTSYPTPRQTTLKPTTSRPTTRRPTPPPTAPPTSEPSQAQSTPPHPTLRPSAKPTPSPTAQPSSPALQSLNPTLHSPSPPPSTEATALPTPSPTEAGNEGSGTMGLLSMQNLQSGKSADLGVLVGMVLGFLFLFCFCFWAFRRWGLCGKQKPRQKKTAYSVWTDHYYGGDGSDSTRSSRRGPGQGPGVADDSIPIHVDRVASGRGLGSFIDRMSTSFKGRGVEAGEGQGQGQGQGQGPGGPPRVSVFGTVNPLVVGGGGSSQSGKQREEPGSASDRGRVGSGAALPPPVAHRSASVLSTHMTGRSARLAPAQQQAEQQGADL